MHTDAKPHSAIFGYAFGYGSKAFLNRKRSGHRAGRSFEYCEHRISRHIDDPALVCIDVFPENSARGIERSHGRPLVPRHQARIAGHVGSKDCCEPLSDRRLRQ